MKTIMAHDRYADLYDFAPVGYLTLDEHGIIQEANLTAADLFQRERTHIVGEPFTSLLAPSEVVAFFSHLRQAFQSGSNATAELKISARGKIRHVLLESKASPKPAEPPRSCRTVLVDITVQKRMSNSLAQQLSNQEALLDMIPAAVFIKNLDLRYVSVNKALTDSMKKSITDLIGKTTFEVYPPDIANNFDRSDRAVLESGKAMLNIEQQIMNENGEKLWISTSKTPWFDPDGRIAGLVGISMDITPIREAEQRASELLQENRRLTRRLFEVQENERRRLSHVLHDELGQWLTAIQAQAQAMYTMPCLEEKPPCRVVAQAIVDSTAQLHQIARRILHRLRPSQLEQLGLADSLRELVSQWQASHPAVDCDIDLDVPLEDLDKQLAITLYRVIQEGLANVSTHSGASRVTLAVNRSPDAIMLSLQDNGMGIPDMSPPPQGIGLLGMRERVIAAGGESTVYSAPGQGLRIDVMLPLNLSGEQ
ncbi:MAG: PAS domain-containing protein [Betaproteobacteria bacterium]